MNLLITGAWSQAKENIPQIEALGHRVCFLQQEKYPLSCEAEWVEGVVCNGLFLSHPIEEFSNLRYIQLTSVGFDRVPMDYVAAQAITIHNARDVYTLPMAEHALACVLWFYRGFGAFQRNQQNHLWEKQRNLRELRGKTVLMIGCGNVGKACADAFSSLGCRVLGIDRKVQTVSGFTEIWNRSFMRSCLPEADIVILCVPLTPENLNLIGDRELSLIRDGGLLINLSRGELLNTNALLTHLPRLGGAALDVFEEEPLPPESPLWDAPNLLLTPHNSFVGEGNAKRLSTLILNNLKAYE